MYFPVIVDYTGYDRIAVRNASLTYSLYTGDIPPPENEFDSVAGVNYVSAHFKVAVSVID